MKVKFPILSTLAIVFVVLKLTDNIDWPWVWVLAPVWIGLCALGLLLLISTRLVAIAQNAKRK